MLRNAAEQERFINTIVNERGTPTSLDLTGVFEVLDKTILVSDKGNAKVAALLQSFLSLQKQYVLSLHIFVLLLSLRIKSVKLR